MTIDHHQIIFRTTTNAPSADNVPAVATVPGASSSGSVLSSLQSSQHSDQSSQKSAASSSSAPPQPSAKRKRKSDAMEAELLSQISGLGELLNSQQNCTADTTDASERLGKMVAEQHRALTPEQQSFFIRKVQGAYMESLDHQLSRRQSRDINTILDIH